MIYGKAFIHFLLANDFYFDIISESPVILVNILAINMFCYYDYDLTLVKQYKIK